MSTLDYMSLVWGMHNVNTILNTFLSELLLCNQKSIRKIKSNSFGGRVSFLMPLNFYHAPLPSKLQYKNKYVDIDPEKLCKLNYSALNTDTLKTLTL